MKKILFSILCLFMLLSSIYAENIGTNSPGYERTESNNYGVNKKWDITDSNRNYVLNTPYVDASKKIYDFVDVITDSEESDLEATINGFIKETGLDFVFVSVDMPYTNDSDNEDYSADFYDFNDFGLNNKHYGGLIFVRNAYEVDPYYTITLFGEAQLYCTTTELDYLLDDIYDYVHSGDVKQATVFILNRFKQLYDKGYDEEKYYIDDDGVLREKYGIPYLTSIISGAITSLLAMLGLIKKNKMVTKASNANDYLVKPSVEYKDKKDIFVSTVTTHHIRSDSSSGGGSSHSGFGHSGGGHISGGRHG